MESLTRLGSQTLQYNAQGRIAATTTAGGSTPAFSYQYNSSAQRLLKTDHRTGTAANTATPATEATLYADDATGSTVLGQYSNQRSTNSAAPAGEADSTEVLWLPTASGPMPIAAQINGRLYAIDSDHLNTPRRLTNAQGQVVWQWLITGYGEVAPTIGATGYAFEARQLGGSSNTSGNVYSEEVNFKLRYPGQVWDEETGLSYNLNRYYDGQAGRYVQSDPIGLDGGWNRFGYVGGDPLNGVDPDGLNPIAVANFVTNIAVRGYGVAQTALYRYAPALTELVAGASGVNGAVVSPISPLVAQIPTTVSRMTPVARAVAEGIESGAFCAASESAAFFRGAKPGELPSFIPRPNDFKINPITGFVRDTHGVSVFDNALSVSSKGYQPHLIDLNTLPSSLRIIQRGRDLHHFEITPASGVNLTPQQFINACSSIVCK